MNYWNQQKRKTMFLEEQKQPGQETEQIQKQEKIEQKVSQATVSKQNTAQRSTLNSGLGQQRTKKTIPPTQVGRFVTGKKTTNKTTRKKKIKKSLQYLMLLKKYQHVIDFKNIKLLRAFLTKFGKIRPRRKTRLPIRTHRLIAKAIRKARAFQLIPFTFDVQI